jgi:glycosyltransferase involved in cell wall biosynthesis
MRVLMLSKACVVGIYQRKLEAIARLGVELLTLVPPSWQDERGELRLERVYTDGYRLETLPIALNGSFHLHFYPGLGRRIRAFRPHIVHIDEEPYNLAAWQALYHARRVGAKTLFFSWQNICRDYPPPFSWGERWVLNHADYALAGTESAAQVWRGKGYAGRLRVIPQFGVDPELFKPSPPAPLSQGEGSSKPFTIGYVGRLVEEKGVRQLIEAASRLTGVEWRLRLIGGGPLKGDLQTRAKHLGLAGRVQFCDQIPSTDMPAQYAQLDGLVLPSLTRPNWKEQFGRVLIEAMACGVPVIGSDSGAIPDIIGDAGLIVPEGEAGALAGALHRLWSEPELRAALGAKGRARALAHFTHEGVAAATVDVYRELML